jgi:hypothetical protein
MSTNTDAGVDIEVINQLDFEPVIPCSVGDCNQEAKWFLICGVCGVGQETVCQPHRQELGEWPEYAQISFDQTCLHSPFIGYCTWTSIDA